MNRKKGFGAMIKYCIKSLFVFTFISYLNIAKASTLKKNWSTIKDSLKSEQLMVVLTNGWDSLQGNIYCFEKSHGKWVFKFSNRVVVGSKGMGIGDGVVQVQLDNAPIKQEGDLKSPAGIFSIGKAFGYAGRKDAAWIKNPYIKATDTLICVDDSHSIYYNRLVNNNASIIDWKSHEEMHRKDDDYKWGLFINHNADHPIAGKGSCIFMHIWESDHTGTSGCTAMEEKNLLRILYWINSKKHPLLVQITKSNYKALASLYRLPNIYF